VIAAYVVGHLLNFLSSITVERYSVWALGYPSKYLLRSSHPGYFHVSSPIAIRRVGRALVGLFLLPVSLPDLVLGDGAQLRDVYAGQLDASLSSVLRKKVSSLTAEWPVHDAQPSAETDSFRYAYHYAVENAPNHLPKMQNYVALYGFLRTLTLIAVMLFWVVVWHCFQGTMTWTEIVATIAGSAALAYVLFMGFSKFYRRFSLEALMALAVTYPPCAERQRESADKD
jgi:cytochrome c oxidase subunit IV